MDNEATLTGSIISLKLDSTFHIKTWYPTPSISCRDSEVIVDSEEVKAQREQEKIVELEGSTQNHCSNQEETSMVP